ncbi:MalY/PatB family protein [Capnocytophaga canimorsus]|uniref:cysteine-S-conjugate beta-lyase n=2 Tax=Capnocytophaga canimorsus TaxID=28188 RepID=F9YUE9_CAPCC|nr:PatB family C-S lyase [Capnocytophaga canimorsus]AEK23004.1 Cysteine lyase [Capnocytophaga canimorsus Cc5]ATA76138.1 cystathionine beta-lyase [Capnocytophaga canimorsus]ATA90740.1 cystathionine beta-lyase [Capnocytophaga canimorsus]AWL77551.1 putative C-S lyase [Capnocytophaga canimorsus]AYW36103.1 putative C-S lyase [Capnocytophaga canimorsus]
MKYNFDEVIDRKGTDATKIDTLQERWGRTDLLPLWVADMDFRTPPFIVDTLKKRIENEVFGYTCKPKCWYDAIIDWQSRRHNWQIAPEMISFTPGVVPALAMAVQALTQPGDKVLIQPPVYFPFAMVVNNNHRTLVNSPLDFKDGQYHINFERLQRDIKGCKLFLFCHPHNPGGRVWTKEEMQKVAEICHENNVIVVSDEIHADLTLPPFKHIPFATVSEKAKNNSITFASPSKAFNMAGFSSSYAVIENPEIRKKFQQYVEGNMLCDGNIFAFQTVVSAYKQGESWLNQMLDYVQQNINFLVDYIREHIPQIHVIVPQASYLVFLDFRPLKLSQEQIVHLCVDGAKLALNDGAIYGEEGEGFMRINLACPRSVVACALKQLKEAIEKQS